MGRPRGGGVTPHGWLVLDKPRGLGSTQAVAAAKRCLREAGYGKVKIGHGGTLDPLAEGVLPIALGEATKLAGRMLDASKVYEFTIRFGEETDTLDTEGAVIERREQLPTLGEIEAVLPRFTGPIEQVPPAYSALKVDGRRAYDLARSGEEVELATRSVTVFSLETLPGPGRKSPCAPMSPRARTSVPSHGTSHARLERSVTSLTSGVRRRVRSASIGRFRWTG